jgi:hypothetical protein
MPREIFVTLTDIQQGEKLNVERCPVAIRLRAEGFEDAKVFADVIDWKTNYGRAELVLPPSVREFVRCFDGTGPAIPFKFHIDEARLIVREVA